MTRNRFGAVGAFVIGGVLLFATGLFLIGDRRMLFKEQFDVYAEFAQIAGLQNGATVRVAGMDAGAVETIHIPKSPAEPFRVKLRIREDLHGLIRLDSVASIQNDGLVGNKFIQVEAGTEQAAIVSNGGTIKSREPFDLADLLNKMNDTVEDINSMVGEVRGSIDKAFSSISAVATDAQGLMDDVGKDLRTIMVSGQRVARDLDVIVGDVRSGRGTVGKLLKDEAFYASAKKIAGDAEKAMTTIREASEQARAAIADFRGDGGPMKGVTGDLQQTLALAREAMADLSESTEALKRNFFFRGFFNRRGFFDLNDVTVDEYRRGALATGDRRVLRIWVGTPVLFERDAAGAERLSADGRQRLDSAMTAFLKYPRTTPFVIEGYSDGALEADRFLSSRRRAQEVRDYLVGKFSLDPNFIATMPMGTQADGSPSGDRWDGVALALFAPSTAR